MQIQVGNTAVAEGLNTIGDELAELQAQIDEDRKKLPLEQIPRSAMITTLVAKAQSCVDALTTVQQDAGDATKSVYDELERISVSLDQLKTLLTSMQTRGTELRSFSFDPITRVITHLRGSVNTLEKRALAANKTRFWPWALLGIGIMGGAIWTLFNLTASSVFLFGDNGSLHELSALLLAFLAMAATVTVAAWQFYRCYLPRSRGSNGPDLAFHFWIWGPLSFYGMVLSLSVMWESWPIVDWLSGYHRPSDHDFLCLLFFFALVGSTIGFIGNLCTHWDDLTD